tara:strand:- start:1246 stop:1380 length:135 start_codon:yes stop_codon:yes gene_type:complete
MFSIFSSAISEDTNFAENKAETFSDDDKWCKNLRNKTKGVGGRI